MNPDTSPPNTPSPTASGTGNARSRSYWRDNVRAVVILLSIWFLLGYGCSIFFIEQLNTIQIGKIGLGFWFAQQGSIFFFVLLVLAYALWMDVLDRKHGVGE